MRRQSAGGQALGLFGVLLVAGLASCADLSGPEAVVEQVTLTPFGGNLKVADTLRLIATAVDGRGHKVIGRPIQWASDHPHIAQVSQDGLVTAIQKGGATITAAVAGVTATAQIIVRNAVSTITITPGTGTAYVGGTLRLDAILVAADGEVLSGRSVSWASSDTNIIRMVLPGLIIGMAPGTATVTATSEDHSASASIRVIQVAAGSVTVTPDQLRLAPGASAQLSGTVFAEDGTPLVGRALSWTSADPAVVGVDAATGLVTALRVGGPVAITAACEGFTATALVTVSQVDLVLVNPSAAILPGASIQLVARALDASDSLVPGVSFVWASADPAVATVDANGLVTGLVVGGPVSITATAQGEFGTAQILVTSTPVQRVTVSPTSQTIPVGGGTVLTAVVSDIFGRQLTEFPVTWSVSDPTVATVSDGTVTALAPGTVTVSATAGGQTGVAVLTIVSSVHLTDLGTLGGSTSLATAVNGLGYVVGESSTTSGAVHGFYWSPTGGMIDLGTLGGPESRALAISDLNDVYGVSETASGEVHAFRWTGAGGLQDLGAIPGTVLQDVRGMSPHGHATGVLSQSGYYTLAFLWDPSTGMRGLAWGDWNSALAVNGGGQVAGFTQWEDAGNGAGPERAFVWSAAGGFVDLGAGAYWSTATAINDNGEVVGQRDGAAYRWSVAGGFQPVGLVSPFGISPAGRVSGETSGIAAVWSAQEGVVMLGTLPGGLISQASGVNDLGQVVGWSEVGPNREHHAVLWTH